MTHRLQQHVYEGHSGRIFSLALCSQLDGRRIAASGSHDRTVKLWCLETQQHIRTIDYSDFVWRVFLVIGSTGKPLVVAFISAEERTVISDVETGEIVNEVKGRLVFAGSVPCFSSPVIILATGEEDIAFVDVESGEMCRHIEGGFGRVFRAVVSYDEDAPILIYTTWNAQNRRSTIQTYELIDRQNGSERSDLISSPPGSQKSPHKVISDTGGDSAATVQTIEKESDLSVFPTTDINTGNAIVRASAQNASVSVNVNGGIGSISSMNRSSSSSRSISKSNSSETISGGVYGGVVSSQSQSQSQSSVPSSSSSSKMHSLFEGDSKDGVTSLAVSRTKHPFICSGHYDSLVRVWDLLSRKLMFTLSGHIDWVVSVAVWKGPEQLVVSGSSDGTIKVWDLRHGALMTTCEGHLRDVWSVTVTEGPRPLIVSASVDRTVRSWDINDHLTDLKWERRKAFCMYLVSGGLLDRGTVRAYSVDHMYAGSKATSTSISSCSSSLSEIINAEDDAAGVVSRTRSGLNTGTAADICTGTEPGPKADTGSTKGDNYDSHEAISRRDIADLPTTRDTHVTTAWTAGNVDIVHNDQNNNSRIISIGEFVGDTMSSLEIADIAMETVSMSLRTATIAVEASSPSSHSVASPEGMEDIQEAIGTGAGTAITTVSARTVIHCVFQSVYLCRDIASFL